MTVLDDFIQEVRPNRVVATNLRRVIAFDEAGKPYLPIPALESTYSETIPVDYIVDAQTGEINPDTSGEKETARVLFANQDTSQLLPPCIRLQKRPTNTQVHQALHATFSAYNIFAEQQNINTLNSRK